MKRFGRRGPVSAAKNVRNSVSTSSVVKMVTARKLFIASNRITVTGIGGIYQSNPIEGVGKNRFH